MKALLSLAHQQPAQKKKKVQMNLMLVESLVGIHILNLYIKGSFGITPFHYWSSFFLASAQRAAPLVEQELF